MMTPEQYLVARIGDLRNVTVLDKVVDVFEEVNIPEDADFRELLLDHPVRVAAWRRILAKARRAKSVAYDDLRAFESERFIQYWRAHEDDERDEMRRFMCDEGDEMDAFGRRKAGRDRMARGDKSLEVRWRKNFTDDLIWAHVRTDDDVLAKRKALRQADAQVELAEGVVDALEHRARCLSHLCAQNRDLR